MPSFDWDVFLSHSTVDKPRVARLAQAGFRPSEHRHEREHRHGDRAEPGAVSRAGVVHDPSRVRVGVGAARTKHGHVSRSRQSRPPCLAAEIGRLPNPRYVAASENTSTGAPNRTTHDSSCWPLCNRESRATSRNSSRQMEPVQSLHTRLGGQFCGPHRRTAAHLSGQPTPVTTKSSPADILP